MFHYNERKVGDGKPKGTKGRRSVPRYQCHILSMDMVNRSNFRFGYGTHGIEPKSGILTRGFPGSLVFSDRKHTDFPNECELVAIVYDGTYNLLDASEFAVGVA